MNWGPTNSPEYPILMGAIGMIMTIAFASAIFPAVEMIVTILLVMLMIIAAIALIRYNVRQRRLDYEAFYGPLPGIDINLVKDKRDA